MDVKYYEAFISHISQELAEKFLSQEDNIAQRAVFIDADIAELTRQIGLQTTQHICEQVVTQQVEQKKNDGFEIKRNPTIQFHVIFGTMTLHSPYLWKKGQHSKPLIDEMEIRHCGRSEAVNRALSDFGSEESFGQAAKRFNEHYHYDLGDSTLSRVTHQTAHEAQAYLEQQFAAGVPRETGESSVPPVETMLVE